MDDFRIHSPREHTSFHEGFYYFEGFFFFKSIYFHTQFSSRVMNDDEVDGF